MPITALPQTTIRAIGSTSVISDPCSVVKELVDNALDALASSLLIEISQNTVDVIQLKDNGHGISSEDHLYVCRRTFTSKIQTIDDLRNVGGTSLGFRGEALASVAEMSGGVIITSRVEPETSASCLKYGRNGELSGTQRASHPVGTTVRITDFLKHVPVRRQTALKGAAKNLTKMKKLLQAYAMAQPSKRFSLKILKAKNESGNWVYAPNINATLSDAAMKIVGTEITSLCDIHEFSSERKEDQGLSEENNYKLVALLPKADSDLSKANNAGQFLSVDGRPLSSSKGVGQDIAKLYKCFVRAAGSKKDKPVSITDPFLCLHLQCPRGSYDVNIEPTKDDILFEDRDLVMSMVEKMLRAQYGELPNAETKAPVKGREVVSNSASNKRRFELLMARKRPKEFPMQTQDSTDSFSLASPLSQNRPHSLDTSSPATSPDRHLISPVGSRQTGANRDSDFINPWSITKMNASLQTPRRPNISLNSPRSPVFLEQNTLQEVSRNGTEHRTQNKSSPNSPDLPSPPISRLASTSPVNRRPVPRRRAPEGLSSDASLMSSHPGRAVREPDRERYGNGALDTWFQKTTQISPLPNPVKDTSSQDATISPLSQLAQKRFPEKKPDESTVHEQGSTFMSPKAFNAQGEGCPLPSTRRDFDSNSSWNDCLPESMDSGRGFPVLEKWAASLRDGPATENCPGLEKALEFERRKREAIQSRRTQLGKLSHSSRAQSDSLSSQSPHRNRYLAARAVLAAEHNSTAEPSSQAEQVNPTGLSPHDPRAYLMRHLRENQPSESLNTELKSRRLRTSRLPFEKISERCDLRDVCLPLSTDMSLLSQSFKSTLQHDLYTQCGDDVEAFSASGMEPCFPFWSRQLATIINEQFKTRNGSRCPEWRVDLSSVMTAHLKNFYPD